MNLLNTSYIILYYCIIIFFKKEKKKNINEIKNTCVICINSKDFCFINNFLIIFNYKKYINYMYSTKNKKWEEGKKNLQSSAIFFKAFFKTAVLFWKILRF